MTDYSVRQAGASDAAVLAKLVSQLGYPTTPEEMAARMQTVLGGSGEAAYLAQAEGVPVGWIGIRNRILPGAERTPRPDHRPGCG